MGILEWIVANKAIVVGAAAVISELVVMTVNTYRAVRAEEQVEALGIEPSKKRGFLWVANPINLFRQP